MVGVPNGKISLLTPHLERLTVPFFGEIQVLGARLKPRDPLAALNGFSSATPMAGHESDYPISPASPLVHTSRALLILYSWERISNTTNTTRF